LSDWAGKRVLVTGATGFIGPLLVQRLVEAGAQAWAGVYPVEPPERAAGLPPQARRVALDVQDVMRVRQAVREAAPDVVLHLAAVGVADVGVEPALALAVNAGGMVNLLDALRGGDVQRVVLVGTCHEYGAREGVEGLDPFNSYAASKVAAWAFGRMYWRAHGLPVVTVRPFQVYGPGQPVGTLIPAAIEAALAGQDFPMTPGEQERDFIYVDDVVAGMLAASVAPGIEGESLDLGTGQAHAVREVTAHIWRVTQARGQILPGALPYRPGEVMHSVADADRTARLTGWRATMPLEEGLRRTIQGYTEQS
jgi:nucleoside-diphosphate-sugar epimerase